MYPSQVRFDKQELEELLWSRVNNLINGLDTNQRISAETKEASAIPPDFLQKYKLADAVEADFMVNRFWTVGMGDPYPDDDLTVIGSRDDPRTCELPQTPEDQVYPQTRLIKGLSPYTLYIPSKEVMVKMMRSCITVKDPQDLWINQ